MSESAPRFKESSFRCPNCAVIAQQTWAQELIYTEDLRTQRNVFEQTEDSVWSDLARATCLVCKKDSVWKKRAIVIHPKPLRSGPPRTPRATPEVIHRWEMIWPRESAAPLPHEALPEELKELHSEARAVLADSPRAAAALLRLLMEKLLQDTTGKTGNLNEQIGLLVERGTFDQRLQETADTIRVSGNKAVHPAQIQSQGDTEEVALIMFELVNFLVDDLIARPRKISHLFETTVPEGAREAIARRDGDKA